MASFALLFLAALVVGPQLQADAALFDSMPAGADATAEAIQALDTDGSGKVERTEIEAFARSQGLSADDVRAEFKTLDTNGDGELEASEISRTLSDEKVPREAAAPSLSQGTLSQGTAFAELHAKEVEHEAQRYAGKALAEVFARTAAKALQSRTEDQEKAKKLEEAAKNLRGQTAEIRRTAAAQTAQAARDAANSVLLEAEGQLKMLQKQAADAEEQAKKKRMEAKQAMDRALSAQTSMTAEIQQLKLQDQPAF